MEKIKIDRFIPYGPTLQVVLNHPSITDARIKNILMKKGIFLNNHSSKKSYPLLLSMIFSPIEFAFIAEHIRAKENTQKILTRTLPWKCDEYLINIIPDKIDVKKLMEQIDPRLEIIKSTNFACIDDNPNKVLTSFKCKTNNYNSGWYRTENEYDGEVILEKNKEDTVSLQMLYTSPETKKTANECLNYITNYFKEKEYITSDASIERVLFQKFSNTERINFFLSLIKNSKSFEFIRIVDLDIAPDKDDDMPIELQRIMTGEVSSLNIKGKSLHDHFLIKDSSNHDYIELAGVEAQYNFTNEDAKGKCNIWFGFDGYFKTKLGNIEFSINISHVSLHSDYKDANIDKIKVSLLKEFEDFKIQTYDNFKKPI